MTIRVGVNGFGRIGRNFWRAAAAQKAGGSADLDIVAVNDITDPATLAHLLKYDSILGRLPHEVTASTDEIRIDGAPMKVLAVRDPAELPWKDLGVDVVVESTGLFTKRDAAAKHLDAGAKKVIISAPATGEDITIVMGVNDDAYDGSQTIISNASCTTNCLAPMAKVLDDVFGIQRGLMTTIHAYTQDQNLQDGPHKDLRRARAAAMSIIPTTTGAAKATSLVIPEVKGKIDGVALRVPTPDVSVVALTCVVEKATTAEAVNDAFRKAAAAGPLKDVLVVSDEPLVSVDYIGSLQSSTVDALSTNVVNGTLVNVTSWYDNEMGYSARCADLLRYVGERL
jgi:glyceraldehyde 3-phosphate dehydrogenase